MTFDETVDYLYGLQSRGIKFGLDNIRRLLGALGNPERSFSSIHVAGTNGKGSTAAMAEAILAAAGQRTGLFTSPHLVSLTERIKVGGVEITEEEVVNLAAYVRAEAEKLDGLSPTFFEVVTAMGFLHFSKKGVQWATVETGLGGRLDSTNALSPLVTVITKVGLDHTDFLGDTLAEVAAEKAGIIKATIPLVTVPQKPVAMKEIKKKRDETGGPLFVLGEDISYSITEESIRAVRFDYEDASGRIDDIFVPLAGRYMAQNAALAVAAAGLALGADKGSIGRGDFIKAVREGLRKLRWPGRLEMISSCENPGVYIDGAHNPQAAEALAEEAGRLLVNNNRKLTLIMGVMADKNMAGIIKPLLPISSRRIFTRPDYGRAAPPGELAALARGLGYPSETAPGVKEAMAMAIKDDIVLITGSFYTIGEARVLAGRARKGRFPSDPWFPAT